MSKEKYYKTVEILDVPFDESERVEQGIIIASTMGQILYLQELSPSDIVENENEALKNKIAEMEKELENAEYHIGQLQQQNKDAEREIDKYR